jgi:hypothetical protein
LTHIDRDSFEREDPTPNLQATFELQSFWLQRIDIESIKLAHSQELEL